MLAAGAPVGAFRRSRGCSGVARAPLRPRQAIRPAPERNYLELLQPTPKALRSEEGSSPWAAQRAVFHRSVGRSKSARCRRILVGVNGFTHDLFLRRHDLIAIGEDSSIRPRLKRGQLVRVAPGIYADAGRWHALDPISRHRMLVLATSERLRSPVVFSHFAAAALFGIRLLEGWPHTVDVTLERATGGRSDGGIRRHCTGLDDVDVVTLGGLAVTSPAQTVVDLARVLPFAGGVVAMDSALHGKREGGALTTRAELLDRCAAVEGKRGAKKARIAAEFSTDLSDSPEESHSRVQIFLAGFPTPELQQTFFDPDGFVADTDFYWRDFDHAGECDGRDKYRNPAFLRGRSPADVVIAEKNRENRLRRVVRTVSRWEPADLYPPSRMVTILARAGLPRSRRGIVAAAVRG